MTGAGVRIGNASGFYGDRESAVREMLTGGDLHYLTGDYLAELTMLILAMDRLKDPGRGFARSFLRQMEEGLGLALDAGVKVVVNAGGLNPAALATAVRDQAERLGLTASVAHVEGDDLLPRAGELGLTGPGGAAPLAANAYLGAWGIVAALGSGADVVVTGRVTDASLVVGPAAHHFGWGPGDLDALAGAVAAGHVVECGTQATGGNFAGFTALPAGTDLTRPGFPITEVYADGSSVITKHPATGGAVTVDTVTAQLLYEIGGARYAGPHATTRLDTVSLTQEGPDRVRLSGTVGEPPPPTLKVGVNAMGGYRNEVVFVLTGLDIEAKAELVQRQMAAAGYGPTTADATSTDAVQVRWTLARTDHPDAASEQEGSALLHCVVRSTEADAVGRRFSNAAIELALASYPGFHVTAPPSNGSPYGVFTAAHLDASTVPHVAVLADGSRIDVPSASAATSPAATQALEPVPGPGLPAVPEHVAASATVRRPLGTVALARSGDKGGSANIGVWVASDDAFAWLAHTITIDRLRELLPETADLDVVRHVLPNLRALNFVVEGILGQGVSSNARFDPQAKALGEWLRSRHVDIPEVLL
ncbi:MAG TPA: DUF1446 domain-containing protein [Acidimicrobiales bacterium]|nr:DUF1446 domain-containing protein [Acidimicrobiales bacterium]